jgi:hypothetical protein
MRVSGTIRTDGVTPEETRMLGGVPRRQPDVALIGEQHNQLPRSGVQPRS